jgi:hypothetical protein
LVLEDSDIVTEHIELLGENNETRARSGSDNIRAFDGAKRPIGALSRGKSAPFVSRSLVGRDRALGVFVHLSQLR